MLSPSDIVAALDRHIVGQAAAKRAVAIAMRNRWRRRELPPERAREITPSNIIMMGPTGVGKTEIARRLAALADAPFIKVEATKYTEVGYHGRDVESIVRDLLEQAIHMVRREHGQRVQAQAEAAVEQRLASLLLGDLAPAPMPVGVGAEADDALAEPPSISRQRILEKLRSGALDGREVELQVRDRPAAPMFGGMGAEQLDPAITSMLESLVPPRMRRARVTVARAREILREEETQNLVDESKIVEQAIERTQESGIVFIDEIDKVAMPAEHSGADVSRQGVQRDLLSIVEGCAVATRHGVVQTDRILFIAAGAFHVAEVGDLMPELQGRFPIRVELEPLSREDLRRILVEPDHALLHQHRDLLAAEGLQVTFQDDAITAIADIAADANRKHQNIGARRLMTIVEHVLEEISFDAPERVARGERTLAIDKRYVKRRVEDLLKDDELGKWKL